VAFKNMSCYVNVPLGKPLRFPTVCPFTGTSAPTGAIYLKHTSTSVVVPLPGGALNSYATTSIKIPTNKAFALVAKLLLISIWLSLLGGIGGTCWFLAFSNFQHEKAATLFLVGGPIVALIFRILRWFVLRRVQLKNPWNGFAELHFKSESYAREFSELNDLSFIGD
jgi:hypothetical protein